MQSLTLAIEDGEPLAVPEALPALCPSSGALPDFSLPEDTVALRGARQPLRVTRPDGQVIACSGQGSHSLLLPTHNPSRGRPKDPQTCLASALAPRPGAAEWRPLRTHSNLRPELTASPGNKFTSSVWFLEVFKKKKIF